MTSTRRNAKEKRVSSAPASSRSGAHGVDVALDGTALVVDVAAGAVEMVGDGLARRTQLDSAPSRSGFSTGGKIDDAPGFNTGGTISEVAAVSMASPGGNVSDNISLGETVGSIIETGNGLLESAGELISGADEVVSSAAGVIADVAPALLEGVGNAAGAVVEAVVEGLGSAL